MALSSHVFMTLWISYLLSSHYPHIDKHMCYMTCNHEINTFLSCQVALILQINGVFPQSCQHVCWNLCIHTSLLCIAFEHCIVQKHAGLCLELPSEFMSSYFSSQQWKIFILKDALDFWKQSRKIWNILWWLKYIMIIS